MGGRSWFWSGLISLPCHAQGWVAMRAAALLIGVETYPDSDVDLAGPADDVIKVRDWMLSYGGVAPPDMTVLVSPRAGWAHRDAADGDATLDTVFQRLRQMSRLRADRIYFYFSGHGIAVATDPERQYLLLADFDEQDAPHKALVLDDVTRYLQSVTREYLLISDACRNFPYGWRPETIGTPFAVAPRPRDLPKGHPVARGGQLCAASPGGVAYIPSAAGVAGSVFTTELLDGLAGRGKAKRWDSSRQCYLVDLIRLQQYVRDAVSARLAAYPEVDHAQAAEAIEVRSTQEPLVLRTIPAADVPRVKLTVGLEPGVVAQLRPEVRVLVDELTYRPWRRANPGPPPMAPFKVQPRSYVLAARATGYRQEQAPLACEVYDNQGETVRLVPSGDQGLSPGGPPPPLPPQARGESAGTLTVDSDEPVTPYLLTSESGETIQTGVGSVRFSLPTGFYRVRPLADGAGAFGEGPAARFYSGSRVYGPEWLVHVGRDAGSSVRLPPVQALPSRAHSALLGFLRESGELITPRWAEWFGTGTSPPIPSLLAYLAELLAPAPRAADLDPFARPGLRHGALGSLVSVIVAVDGGDEDEARRFTERLRIHAAGSRPGALPQPLELSQLAAPGLGLASVLAPPGQLTVRVGPEDGDVIDMRVPVLADRPAALIWHVGRTGRLDLRLAYPQPDAPVPGYGRRIDLMQQLASLGLPGAVARVGAPTMSPGAADPVASLICAAALSGPDGQVRPPSLWLGAQPLPPAFEADELAFWAARLDAQDRPQEARGFFELLSARDDLPVTATATRLMLAGLRRHELAPGLAGRLERALRSQMLSSPWSAVWNDAWTHMGKPNPPRTKAEPEHAEPVVVAPAWSAQPQYATAW
jgi:Caspase domain